MVLHEGPAQVRVDQQETGEFLGKTSFGATEYQGSAASSSSGVRGPDVPEVHVVMNSISS